MREEVGGPAFNLFVKTFANQQKTFARNIIQILEKAMAGHGRDERESISHATDQQSGIGSNKGRYPSSPSHPLHSPSPPPRGAKQRTSGSIGSCWL